MSINTEKGDGEVWFVLVIAVLILFLACRYGGPIILSLLGG